MEPQGNQNKEADTQNSVEKSSIGGQDIQGTSEENAFIKIWLSKIISLDYFDKIWVPIFTGIGAVLLTHWFSEQANIRQETASRDINHQAIFESYISKINEMHLNEEVIEPGLEAKNDDFSLDERELIYGMTLPILRDLTADSERKARLILFLYRRDIIDVGVKNFGDSSLKNPLNTADLKNANFEGYNLENINFHGADLRGTNFNSAILRNSQVAYANFSASDVVVRSWWSRIPLVPSFLPGYAKTMPKSSDLIGVKLTGANLLKVNFEQANLKDADLTKANLTKAKLKGANLTCVKLDHSILNGVEGFDEVTIDTPHQDNTVKCGENEEDAFDDNYPKWQLAWQVVNDKIINKSQALIKADLSNVNLSGVDLSGFDFSEAILKGAILDHALLKGAKGIESAKEIDPKWPLVWRLVNGRLENKNEILKGADLSQAPC